MPNACLAWPVNFPASALFNSRWRLIVPPEQSVEGHAFFDMIQHSAVCLSPHTNAALSFSTKSAARARMLARRHQNTGARSSDMRALKSAGAERSNTI